MKKHLSLLITFFLLFSGSLHAKCIGLVPVWNTGDTEATCRAKQNRTEPRQPENPAPKKDVRKINDYNQGPGSGHHNININTDRPPRNPYSEISRRHNYFTPSVHQARLEMSPYIIPNASQFDEPGMPEQLFPGNGLAWEYWINKSLGAGILLQQFSVSGGRGFDPIQYTDSSGDVHSIGHPGAVNRLKYNVYIPYVVIDGVLSEEWSMGARLGIGRVSVEAEYNESKVGSGNQKYDDNFSMLIDVYFGYKIRGFILGSAFRYINARSDTNDYLEYMNLGGVQFVLFAQFMIPSLGEL